MRKKILSFALACLMFVMTFSAAIPVIAGNVETYRTAPEGATKVKDATELTAALANTEVSNISITGDIEASTAFTVASGRNITVYGNGYALTTNTDAWLVYGTLTVYDMNVTQTAGACLTTKAENAKITFDNYDITHSGTRGSTYFNLGNKCVLDIVDSNITFEATAGTATEKDYTWTAFFACTNSSKNITINLDGTTIDSTAVSADDIMVGVGFREVNNSTINLNLVDSAIKTNGITVANLRGTGKLNINMSGNSLLYSKSNYTIHFMGANTNVVMSGDSVISSGANVNVVASRYKTQTTSGSTTSYTGGGAFTLEMNDNAAIKWADNVTATANLLQLDFASSMTIEMKDNANITNNGSGVALRGHNSYDISSVRPFNLTMSGNSQIYSASNHAISVQHGTVTKIPACTIEMRDSAKVITNSTENYAINVGAAASFKLYLDDNAALMRQNVTAISALGTAPGIKSDIHMSYEAAKAHAYGTHNFQNNVAPDIVAGASISTVKNQEGIRFTADFSTVVSRSSDIEAGFIIAMYDDFDGVSSFIPATLDANGIKYVTQKVTDKDSTGIAKKNVALINIDNYEDEFAVRTYTKYNYTVGNIGGEGCSLTVYSSFSRVNHVRSMADVARMALKDTRTSEQIANDATLADTYNCLLDDGTYSRYTQAQVNVLTEIAAYTESGDIAVNKTADNGVTVRNVSIDAAGVGEAINIVQLTDIHLDLTKTGSWSEDAVTNAGNVLAYAADADKMVVTGDVMSILHDTNISQMNAIFSAENIMMCVGNHDVLTTYDGKGETSTLEERLATLEKAWKNDLYYSSEKIEKGDNKVMLIQMDNATQLNVVGKSAFWDKQVPLLEADLAYARANGYVVLVFYHIPLDTHNAKYDYTKPVGESGDSSDTSANFYNNYENLVGNYSEGASKQIYELITNSADVIAATFCGHMHRDYYTEIDAKTADGTRKPIPQYVLVGTAYDGGHAINITVS